MLKEDSLYYKESPEVSGQRVLSYQWSSTYPSCLHDWRLILVILGLCVV